MNFHRENELIQVKKVSQVMAKMLPMIVMMCIMMK